MPEDPLTDLLQRWSDGDGEAATAAAPLIYDELRRIAAAFFRSERADHTLQATAVVHEAYLRLCVQRGLHWTNRFQFYGFAAHLIRRVLVDHARAHRRAKRGGAMARQELSEAAEVTAGRPPELLDLDAALTGLERVDPRKASIVELRFFGGLTVEETADHLRVSPETVKREWRRAKAWLRRELTPREVRHGS